IRRVHSTHYQAILLDHVEERVLRLSATDQSLMDFDGLHYHPTTKLRTYWNQLARDEHFVGQLRRLASSILRQAAFDRIWLREEDMAVETNHRARLDSGTFKTWAGLSVQPLLHRPPEGLLLALARRVCDRRRRS